MLKALYEDNILHKPFKMLRGVGHLQRLDPRIPFQSRGVLGPEVTALTFRTRSSEQVVSRTTSMHMSRTIRLRLKISTTPFKTDGVK